MVMWDSTEKICFRSNHRKFSAEFRAEAMELVVSSGRPVAQVAPEIGVVAGTLGIRVRVWKEEHPDVGAKDPGPVEWATNEALQTENGELKREIEFLGKISAVFAATQRQTTLHVHQRGDSQLPDRMDVPEAERPTR